jgi:hypothetical protein
VAEPVPQGKWAHEHDCCAGCGTTQKEHHAKGYCRSCAPRALYYQANGWPTGVAQCAQCQRLPGEVGYRSRGLCNHCWEKAAAANTLAEHGRKQAHRGLAGGQLLARQLVDLVGVSQAARDLHVPKPKFVAMVKGKVHVSQAMARRITKTLREYQR